MTRAALVLCERGELPFAALNGTALWVRALDVLLEAGADDVVVIVDDPQRERVTGELAGRGLAARAASRQEWWLAVLDGPPDGVLLHDALCPLVSPALVREVATRGGASSVAAYRPVTDTVKTVVDGRVADTIDREGLAAVVAPVLVGAAVLAGPEAPPLGDFGGLVEWLRSRGRVELVEAPSLARRVDDESAVTLLECVSPDRRP